MLKKSFAVVSALMLIMSLTLTACKTNKATQGNTPNANPNDGPFVKYDSPVTVKVAISESAVAKYPQGDSRENNVWTRTFKDQFNIDVKVQWLVVGDDKYETKMNLAIASNDLPDIIELKNYSQFDKLVKNDKLADLTSVYEKYAYPKLKEWYTQDGGQMKSWGTVGGKMLGFATGGINYQTTRMIHIRSDWFKESGLAAPKTLEDVINIARAFKAKDPSRYGFTMDKTIVGEGMGDLVGFANAAGVYPRMWVKDSSGKLVYGSVQPGMKNVLSQVAGLYKEGLIDPEFAVKTGTQVGEQLTGGKIGVIIGNFWLESWPLNSLYKSDGIDWDVYPLLPTASNTGKLKVQTDPVKGAMVCVKKGYEHPEILFKMLSFEAAKVNDPEMAETSKYHSDDNYGYFGMVPVNPVMAPIKINFETQPHVTDAIDKKDTSFLKTPHDQTQYKSVKAYVDALAAGKKPLDSDWAAYKFFYGKNSTFGVQNYYFDNDSYLTSELLGYETPEMSRKKTTLEQMEDTAFVEIVTGKKPVSYFDEFVQQWKDLGGELIEYEVNEWYKAKK